MPLSVIPVPHARHTNQRIKNISTGFLVSLSLLPSTTQFRDSICCSHSPPPAYFLYLFNPFSFLTAFWKLLLKVTSGLPKTGFSAMYFFDVCTLGELLIPFFLKDLLSQHSTPQLLSHPVDFSSSTSFYECFSGSPHCVYQMCSPRYVFGLLSFLFLF